MEFSSPDQYITIPTVPQDSENALLTNSMTISMWVRFRSFTSGSRSYLSRSVTSDLSQDLYSITIDANGKLFASIGAIGGDQEISSPPLTLNQWTLISASFTLKADFKHGHLSLQINEQYYDAILLPPLSTALLFSASDRLLVGGPSGVLATIYGIKVLSPGSHVYLPWDSSTHQTFGLSSTFLRFVCDPVCSTCYGTLTTQCLSCSTASYGLYNSNCQTCPSGTAISETKCSSCPKNCKSCSTIDSCDVCHPDYYVASDRLCAIICPQGCQSCSSVGTCDVCSPGYFMTKKRICASAFVPNAIAATTGGRTTTDMTTQVATVAANGNSGGVQAQVSGRIFISIQYLNITYSNDVKAILANTAATLGHGDPRYTPNIPESLKSHIVQREVPPLFEKYGLSSSFILNFWKKMMLLLMIFTIVALALSIEFAMTRWGFLKKIPSAMIREYAQNYLLTQLYTCVGDAVLYSTLHYRASNFWSKSELADFILSVFFLIAVFTVPVWHYFIVFKYQKIKSSRENSMNNNEILKNFQESNKGIKLFFENFHDSSKPRQLFLIFLAVRDMLFSLVLTMLFHWPLLQILILLIMNIAMIAFLIMKRPFKNIFNLIQQLYYELLVFLAFFVLIILIGLDMNNSQDDHARDVLGKVLIIESLLFTYGTLILTTLAIHKTAFDYFQALKKNKAELEKSKEVTTEENPCVIALEDVGISFPSENEKEKPSVLNLNQEELNKSKNINEGASPRTVNHSEASSPQSKLIGSPMGTPGGNLESEMLIKLSKFKNS